MYDDPDSELGKIYAKCQWWIMWSDLMDGASLYMKSIRFDQPAEALSRASASEHPTPKAKAFVGRALALPLRF
jgi:hypothetical protein